MGEGKRRDSAACKSKVLSYLNMFKRSITLDLHPQQSFFLWGPRQVGKSALLRSSFPSAVYLDLLQSDQRLKYQTSPHLLREEMEKVVSDGLIVIDEIQKVPALLDEVHWLIENRGKVFALCGSSARKVRRGHANLLGGRAIRYELFGLISREIGNEFDLLRMLNHGYLPRHYLSESPTRLLRSYCADYLQEEIASEGLVRNLPAFANFLEIAALSDAEQVNFATIARDCGVAAPTVKEYFQLLVDTLMASFLPPFRKKPKRRIVTSPKFYFSDVGVVNFLAKRDRIQWGTETVGKAFESWVHHELSAHRAYSELFYDLSYWKLSIGTEVDFILSRGQNIYCAVEAKASSKVTSDHLKGLKEFYRDHPNTKHRVVVCTEKTSRRTEEGIDILPYSEFVKWLWERGKDFS